MKEKFHKRMDDYPHNNNFEKEEKKKRNKIINDNVGLIGKNIAYLREQFGESRKQLAEAIGVGYSAVSNYENSPKKPDLNELIAISNHYKITMDLLIKHDFSLEIINRDILINNVSNHYLIWDTLLPIVGLDKNIENSNFNEALELHQKIYEALCEDNTDYAESYVERCGRLYQTAEKEGIIEATANLLWWPMYVCICVSFSNEKVKKLKSKDATVADALKALILENVSDLEEPEDTIYLKDLEDLVDIKDLSKLSKEDKHRITIYNYLGDILGRISLLKQSSDLKLRELAEYYIAIAYRYNVLGNGRLSKTEGLIIGEELLRAYRLTGNTYAENFYSILKDKDNYETLKDKDDYEK